MKECGGTDCSKSSGVYYLSTGLVSLDWPSFAESSNAVKHIWKGLENANFSNAKTILAILRVKRLSQKPLFRLDQRVLYVEVGEFPNWRSLGTLIRDRREYTICNRE